eukprot:s2961_g6.t1
MHVGIWLIRSVLASCPSTCPRSQGGNPPAALLGCVANLIVALNTWHVCKLPKRQTPRFRWISEAFSQASQALSMSCLGTTERISSMIEDSAPLWRIYKGGGSGSFKEMRIQQVGLWRMDVRDAVELTPKKMEVYLLVIAIELTGAGCCLCKGRIPPGAPPWMVAAGDSDHLLALAPLTGSARALSRSQGSIVDIQGGALAPAVHQ